MRIPEWMQKSEQSVSISRGYLHLAQIFLLCGILLTGVIMICSAVGTYTDTVKDALLRNCEALSATVSALYEDEDGYSWEDMEKFLQTSETEYHYLLSLYDDNGVCLYPASGSPLSPSIRAYTRTDDYLQVGYYTEDAEEAQLCCTIRFLMQDENGDIEWFYLRAIREAGNLTEYTRMLTVNLIVCLLVATLLFMVLFSLGASKMDKEFQKISRVVQQYAEGDFSARADVPEHHQLYPLACTLSRMAECIEQNESTRRNFVANVSHELRTPMTTIGGFADCMLDGTIPPEQHGKYLRTISEEIHRLQTLIHSMLNLSKFEAGEMQLHCKQFDVAGLLIRTVFMFEKRIVDKHVDVEGLEDASLMVYADEDLIFQVLYNLIENAVKFVNEGGTIRFALYTEGRNARICVTNTGEGLADEELPKVFDRFYKTDTSRSKDKTGLGLGLSIARKIVHLHQGNIVVKSVKGEYTSFEVQIPVNRATT